MEVFTSKLGPRSHGSQIFARTKSCTVPPCARLHETGVNERIFERPSVQVWDLKKEGPKLAHLAVQKFVQSRPIPQGGNVQVLVRAKSCQDPGKRYLGTSLHLRDFTCWPKFDLGSACHCYPPLIRCNSCNCSHLLKSVFSQARVVSFAAVFWMSRNVPPALRDIPKNV